MKNRAIIPLVLGLAIGLVAVKFTVDALKRAKGSNVPVAEMQVVVASHDISASVRIEPDMLMVKSTPPSPLLPPDAYKSLDDLSGRVTRKFIPQGTPLAASMLAPEGTIPGIEERIPDGFRAYTVKVGESTGVGYLLRPGCFVDVLVVMQIRKPGRKTETISRILLQRMKVGAVGQTLNDDTDESGAKRVRSVTLIVPEEDVPRLHLAETKGKLALALRSGTDDLLSDGAQAGESELTGLDVPPDEADLSSPPNSPGPLASAVEASPEQVPAEPQPEVTVINGSDAVRLTFRDVGSMSVLSMKRGLTPGDAGPAYGSTPTGVSPGLGGDHVPPFQGLTDRERQLRRQGAGSMDADFEPEIDDFESEEVTE